MRVPEDSRTTRSWPRFLATISTTSYSPYFRRRHEAGTIDATAMGTSAQSGKNVSVKVIINQFSTAEDRQVLVEAFKTGQSQGLVDALSEMKLVGRAATPGTLGYDLAYIRLIRTCRKIRFATNRLIRFGEAYYDTESSLII
jgi:hypothetical protein